MASIGTWANEQGGIQVSGQVYPRNPQDAFVDLRIGCGDTVTVHRVTPEQLEKWAHDLLELKSQLWPEQEEMVGELPPYQVDKAISDMT